MQRVYILIYIYIYFGYCLTLRTISPASGCRALLLLLTDAFIFTSYCRVRLITSLHLHTLQINNSVVFGVRTAWWHSSEPSWFLSYIQVHTGTHARLYRQTSRERLLFTVACFYKQSRWGRMKIAFCLLVVSPPGGREWYLACAGAERWRVSTTIVRFHLLLSYVTQCDTSRSSARKFFDLALWRVKAATSNCSAWIALFIVFKWLRFLKRVPDEYSLNVIPLHPSPPHTPAHTPSWLFFLPPKYCDIFTRSCFGFVRGVFPTRVLYRRFSILILHRYPWVSVK